MRAQTSPASTPTVQTPVPMPLQVPTGTPGAPVAQGAPVPGQNPALAGITLPDAPPPVLPTQQITYAEAIAIALRNNPQINQTVHQILSARNNLSAQRSPLNPTVAFAGLNSTVGALSPFNLGNYAFYGTIETSGRQTFRTQTARALLEQTQADTSTTRLNVRQTTANAYIALQVANQSLLNEQQAYATSLRLRDLTRKQFELEAAPEVDAIRAEIALTQEEQNLLTAVGNVKQARANLNNELGRPPETPVDTADSLRFTPVTVDLPTLQKRAALGRPEVRSGEAIERELAATVKTERSQYYPDLILGTDGKFDQVQAGFTLPLFDFGAIRGAVRKAKEDVKVQKAVTEQTRQQVQLQVQNAYDTLQQARKAVVLYESKETGILMRSEFLLQRTQQGYTLGASTIIDLITAQDTLRQARNSYYTAIGNYQQAITQTESAIGQPL